MRADEARQKTLKARDVSIDSILATIKLAAEKGDECASWHIPHDHAKFADSYMGKLKALGYRVKRNTYSDPRESCDYLEISW